MNDEELQLALDYLGHSAPLRDGAWLRERRQEDGSVHKTKWDLYLWNPPHGMKIGTPMLAPDPDAGPKPTWEELEKAAAKASDYELRKGGSDKAGAAIAETDFPNVPTGARPRQTRSC